MISKPSVVRKVSGNISFAFSLLIYRIKRKTLVIHLEMIPILNSLLFTENDY